MNGLNRFECPDCGRRFDSNDEVSACNFCSTVCGSDNHVDRVAENALRVYCEDCDFEVDIDKSTVQFPMKLAEGRKQLHESQGSHRVMVVGGEDANGVKDNGMSLCGTIESEDQLQDWLESYFEKQGWTAIREVSPHNSNYKADLVVNHSDYGWMGIETKYFDGDGGAKIAQAHHQLTRKYRGEKYIGNRINLWAFCPYFNAYNSPSRIHSRTQITRAELSRELFCKHGIGYIDLDRNELLIDFAYSQPVAKVPVDANANDRYYENVDMDDIQKAVKRKMEKYDYK